MLSSLYFDVRYCAVYACACYCTARRFPLSTRGERLAFLFVLLTLSHRSLTLYPARDSLRGMHTARKPRCRTAPMTACEYTCCMHMESRAYSLRHLLTIQNREDVARLRIYVSYYSVYPNDLRNYWPVNFIHQLFHASLISEVT